VAKQSRLDTDQKPKPGATLADYQATFVGFKPGQKVLEDLLGRFHDRPVYVPGGLEGQRETEKRAAQKEVVGYILRKLGQIEEDPNA
jgi:hypothetical protein